MKFAISAWAIRNPVPVSLLFIALIIAGISGYNNLLVKLYPDVSFPIVQIAVTLPGAAPVEVETQVTREVEAAVSNIAGVNHIKSTVSQGLSSTTVEFEIGQDAQTATDKVRSAIDGIRSSLPRSIEVPIVQQRDIETSAVVTYAVAAKNMSDIELSWFIDDTVTRQLIAQTGVAQVQRIGGVNREINITLNPARLLALNLTASQINAALLNFNVNVPGGRSDIGMNEQIIRVVGEATTVANLRNMVIPTSTNRTIRLGDVATVSNGAAERRGFARLDGRPVVGFQVMKTNEASDVAVANAIQATTIALEKKYPDITFTRILSTATSTQDSFIATLHALLEGMILASIVVFIFLRDWRATVIAALAMPISLLPTFAVMNYMGFSLNMITLLALTLVIGILVDDAIVEIENIQKRIEAGESPYRASITGADTIGLAVIATTLTIVVVFLPVSLMGGFAGQFFKEFGFTVAISVLFSLLVARFLTPLLAAYFLKPSTHPHPPKDFKGFYKKSLDYALTHRLLSISVGAAIFIGSVFLSALLPAGLTPPQDNGIVQLSIEGAPGSTLSDMEKSSYLLANKLRTMPDVMTTFTNIGSSGLDGSVRSGGITVLLKKQRSQTTQEFQESLKPLLLTIPDIRLGFAAHGGGGSTTVQIILAGDNKEQLDAAGIKAVQQMRGLKELSGVHQVTSGSSSELIISPKPDEAAALGVTSMAIGNITRIATQGDVDSNVAKFNDGNQRLPIRIRLPDSQRDNLSTIKNMLVPTSSGIAVPLSVVANISFEPGTDQIDRFDRNRQITIEGELNGVSLGQATKAINNLPIMKNLPDGITQPAYGQTEHMAELFKSFTLAIAAGIGLIFGVLVLLFHSFFKPVTILAALPLSIAGAFIGLLLTGSEIGLSALIGFLMLMGLAAKNSILLVEFAIEAERSGMTQKEALYKACHERSRPIIMTTVAMAAGMLPTALALGEGSEFRAPMAVAVIGGLISSTLLSLVLVPVVYELIDDLEIWIKPILAHLITRKEESDAEI